MRGSGSPPNDACESCVYTTTSHRPLAGRVSTSAGDYEAKVVILATGAMGDAPILLRSRNDLPSLSDQLGQHLVPLASYHP